MSFPPSLSLAYLLKFESSVKNVKNRFTELTYEVSSGKHYDLPRHAAEQIETHLRITRQYDTAIANNKRYAHLENLSSVTQTALDSISKTIGSLPTRVLDKSLAGINNDYNIVMKEVKVAFNFMTQQLNLRFNDKFVFSGYESNTLPFKDPSTLTNAILTEYNNAVGAGVDPVTGKVDFTAALTAIDSMFDGTKGAGKYFGEFFQASEDKLYIWDGTDSPTNKIYYGLTGNEPSLRKLFQGMMMAMTVPENATLLQVKDWIEKSASLMQAGNDELIVSRADLGTAEKLLQNYKEAAKNVAATMERAIADIEQKDPELAATELKSVQFQLDASYYATKQLYSMSLLNYFK